MVSSGSRDSSSSSNGVVVWGKFPLVLSPPPPAPALARPQAIIYLQDAEKKKVPLCRDDYTSMRYYSYHESRLWRHMVVVAYLLFILSSLLEEPFHKDGHDLEKDWYIILVEVISSLVFFVDIHLKVDSTGC